MATTYRDLSVRLTKNPLTNDLSLITDEAAIIASCRNILLGKKRERPFKSYLTANLEGELFELLTPITAANIKRKIENAIRNYEPRVEQVRADVSINNQKNGYDISVYLLPKKSINPTGFNFFLAKSF